MLLKGSNLERENCEMAIFKWRNEMFSKIRGKRRVKMVYR